MWYNYLLEVQHLTTHISSEVHFPSEVQILYLRSFSSLRTRIATAYGEAGCGYMRHMLSTAKARHCKRARFLSKYDPVLKQDSQGSFGPMRARFLSKYDPVTFSRWPPGWPSWFSLFPL